MYIERKHYTLGGAQHAISYSVTDDHGHTAQLSPSEALEVLTQLNLRRSQIFRDLHPEEDYWIESPEEDARQWRIANGTEQ